MTAVLLFLLVFASGSLFAHEQDPDEMSTFSIIAAFPLPAGWAMEVQSKAFRRRRPRSDDRGRRCRARAPGVGQPDVRAHLNPLFASGSERTRVPAEALDHGALRLVLGAARVDDVAADVATHTCVAGGHRARRRRDRVPGVPRRGAKRDILFDTAARFLRLTEDEVRAMTQP